MEINNNDTNAWMVTRRTGCYLLHGLEGCIVDSAIRRFYSRKETIHPLSVTCFDLECLSLDS
jgi:hypothetical protein